MYMAVEHPPPQTHRLPGPHIRQGSALFQDEYVPLRLVHELPHFAPELWHLAPELIRIAAL